MNDSVVFKVGAFVKWIFKGFKTSLEDEIKMNFNFSSKKERCDYEISTYLCGYIGTFVIIILMGLILKLDNSLS